MIRYLLIFMLLCAPAWSAQIKLDTCTVLPYDVSAFDTVTIDGGNAAVGSLYTAAGLITSSTDDSNVFLDYENDVTYFNTGNTNSIKGIQIGTRCNNWIIRSDSMGVGKLIDSATTATGTVCIQTGNQHDLTIRNMYIEARGEDKTVGICSDDQAYANRYNLLVDSCIVKSFGDDYQRTAKEVCAIKLDLMVASASDSDGFLYHVRITESDLFSQHIAVYLAGDNDTGAIIQMDACSLDVDAVNTGVGESFANCYALSAWGLASNDSKGIQSYVTNCIITSGTSEGGGRGIIIEHCEGTSDRPILFRNITMDVHRGPSGLEDLTWGIRLRWGGPGQHVLIDSNDITVRGDTNTSTSAYGSQICALALETCVEGADGPVPYYNVTARHNQLETIIENGADIDWAHGILFEVEEDAAPTIEYNHVVSCDNIIRYSEINCDGSRVKLNGDTLRYGTTLDNDHYTFKCGDGATFNAVNDTVLDVVYENAASDDSAECNFVGATSADMCFMRTLVSEVLGNNAEPVPGCTVIVWNAYQDSTYRDSALFIAVVDSCGLDSTPVTYQVFINGAADSVGFQQMRIKATTGSDSVSITYTVSATANTPSLTLTGTAGDDSGCAAEEHFVKVKACYLRKGRITK